MRRLRLSAALLGLVAILPCHEAASQNLLNNPGFETDVFFDFSDETQFNGFFGGPPGSVLEAFNTTGATPFAGAQALELEISAGTDPDSGAPVGGFGSFTGHVQLVPGINPGDEVLFSVYARNNSVDDPTGTVEVRIEYEDSAGAILGTDQINLEAVLTDSFQLFDVSGIAPVDTVAANAVFAIASFVPGTEAIDANINVVFDNASLSVVPEPTSLMLLAVAGTSLLAGRRRN